MKFLQFAKNLPDPIKTAIAEARTARLRYLRGEIGQDEYTPVFDKMCDAIKGHNETVTDKRYKLPVPNLFRFE